MILPMMIIFFKDPSRFVFKLKKPLRKTLKHSHVCFEKNDNGQNIFCI